CAEFPVTVHVSDRAQATLVLSCPGLDPTGLDRWADGPPSSLPPTGLEGELRAARAEWDRTGSSKELARHRVRYRGRDSGGPIEAGRARLHHELSLPRAEDFPPEPPPEASGNLAELPLTFSESLGIVAFAGHPAGWSLHRFSEGGAEPVPLTVANPPDSLPGRTPGGDRRLRAYLHYLVERDDAFDTVLAGEAPPGPLVEHVAGDLVRTGATVLARAFVLQRLHGGHGPLDETDVWLGIRATDAEWLDRPTVGRRF
ncbi:MAG TPA: hypothetical protein VJQ43_05220, partial [Thermoplasmata archaeon]|nr:hypothetical protein [Thermoplasmata archaeon]